jgi:hypothetical protein
MPQWVRLLPHECVAVCRCLAAHAAPVRCSLLQKSQRACELLKKSTEVNRNTYVTNLLKIAKEVRARS